MQEVRYVEIPGDLTLELPPLLVRGAPDDAQSREELVSAATEIVESTIASPMARWISLCTWRISTPVCCCTGNGAIRWSNGSASVRSRSARATPCVLYCTPRFGRTPAVPASSICSSGNKWRRTAWRLRKPSEPGSPSGSRRRSPAARISSCSI